MATVTKLKAEVENKNLPILLQDGSVVTYYVGKFVSKLLELGYSLSQDEKGAVEALINSGINNGWIDSVQYLLPFIGDSANPAAGIVPLIDNVADYAMEEYDPTHNYSSLFEYSGGGKIKSLHASSTSVTGIVTPVTYSSQKRGLSLFMNLNMVNETGFSNFVKSDPAVEVGGVAHYVRARFQHTDGKTVLRFLSTSTQTSDPTIFVNNIPNIISSNSNANMSYFSRKLENDAFVAGQFVQFGANKVYKPLSSVSVGIPNGWDDLSYGKYSVGDGLSTQYIKVFAFIDPDISQASMERLSSDIFTFVNALGRD